MKSRSIKLLRKVFASLLLTITVVAFIAVPVTAHEIYRNYPMRMQDRNSSNGPLLHVHYKYMRNEGAPAHYYDCAIDAKDVWAGFADVTDGGCNQLIPTEMNISFRCSEDVWSSMGFSSSVLGYTWIVDTNGNAILTESDARTSSGVIDYSIIYMNPTGNIFYTGTDDLTVVLNRIQKTMVHEIGHAMGLGHPDRESYSPIADATFSIMRQGFPDMVNSGIIPQAHDRLDLNIMYGSNGGIQINGGVQINEKK